MTPEQLAREKIDAQLTACGWVIQNYKELDLSASRGIAIREVPLTTGPCDYLLLADRKPVGIVEAKKQCTLLSTVAEQSGRHAPFTQRGGLGKAHQLFGEQLSKLLDELNEVLAA